MKPTLAEICAKFCELSQGEVGMKSDSYCLKILCNSYRSCKT